MKLREVIAALEHLAPLRLQDEWDNSGLQVGFPESEIDQVLVCLDVTEAIVDEAIAAPPISSAASSRPWPPAFPSIPPIRAWTTRRAA